MPINCNCHQENVAQWPPQCLPLVSIWLSAEPGSVGLSAQPGSKSPTALDFLSIDERFSDKNTGE